MTVIPRKPSEIAVIGLVKRPGQYEIPFDTDLRLLGALALGGGLTMEIVNKVNIIRTPPDGSRAIVIRASVRKAKRDGAANIRLAPGDVVSVEETPLTFIVGTIRDFVRLGFSSAVPGL
ncbi:MAG: hypothetical protein IH861_00690 [Chloroflexi bacterium]|nr:hypothetical protein [Chloroflexota bacterium]